jgi:hypothetical protein
MRGHRFPSLEEISAAVTRAIRGLNKSGTLHETANLPKPWDAVIEKQGCLKVTGMVFRGIRT